MRPLLALVAICLSASAFAQAPAPKPPAQVKPKEPMGCKFVGTVRGTKLWAGDCVSSEFRGTTSAETQSLSDRASGAIPPNPKQ